MNGLKYALSIIAISCAGILLQASPDPETYDVPAVEFSVPSSTPQSCQCGVDCDCRIVSSEPVKAVTVRASKYNVGDVINIDGSDATITQVIVEANGKTRLKWERRRLAQSTGSHWTFPGMIDNHLRSTHGVDVSGMSREQMLSTHDAIHESSTPIVRQSQSYYQPQVQSNCPGGVCPSPSRTRTLFRW